MKHCKLKLLTTLTVVCILCCNYKTHSQTPISITGSVFDTQGNGIVGVTIEFNGNGPNNQTGQRTSGEGGSYAYMIQSYDSLGWSGEIRAIHDGYQFDTVYYYVNLTENLSELDFIGTYQPPISITGSVFDTQGNGIAGVTIEFNGDGPNNQTGQQTSFSDGSYAYMIQNYGFLGWSGEIRAILDGYQFDTVYYYVNLTENLSELNFTGVYQPPISITGSVFDTLGNGGIGEVIIEFNGDGPNNQTGQQTSFSDGSYAYMIQSYGFLGWSGEIRAIKAGYHFDTIYNFANLTENLSELDFTGTLIRHTISGILMDTVINQPVIDAFIKVNGITKDTTNSDGSYTFQQFHFDNITITPEKAGYVFYPVNITIDSIVNDFPNQNFNASLKSYKISGRVRKDGIGIDSVKLIFQTDATLVDHAYFYEQDETYTNNTGYYEIDLYHGWKGAITPSKYLHTFIPSQIPVNQPLNYSLSQQDFSATLTGALSVTLQDIGICFGEDAFLIPDVSGGEAPYFYQWFINGELVSESPEFIVSPDSTTVYEIRVRDTLATATSTITVTVHDLPDPSMITIKGDTIVCANQSGMIYEISSQLENHSFSFNLLSGGVVVDIGEIGNRIVINWGPDSSEKILQVVAENKFGCTTVKGIPIHIGGAAAPLPTGIVRKTNSNILISMDTTATNYQWGYINPNTWQITKPAGATERFHNFGSGFNPNTNIYFVDRSFDDGGCVSRSFFGSSVVGIHNPTLAEPFTIIPNPFSDYLIIRSAISKDVAITIVNNIGSIIYSENAALNSSTDYRLKTTNLKHGIYFLRIGYDNRFITTKVLKF